MTFFSMDKLTFIIAIVIKAVTCQQDLTRSPGTSGPEVVEAVVNIIKQTCIFPDDKLFIRRLAYVESFDGLDADTYQPGVGGIWRVDENAFNQTQQAAYLSHYRDEINKTLLIDWAKVTFDDLRKPLYSGLAAALSMTLRAGDKGFPSTVEKQAVFWAAGGTQANTFVRLVRSLKIDFKNDIDVAFLLDSSASLSPSDFNKTKTFVVDVVSGFDVALDRVRVALVVYSTQAYPRFFLNTFSTKAAVLLAVQNLTYTPGGTNTRDGLNYIKNNIFTSTNGARPTASKVIILITDGRSDDRVGTVDVARALQTSGVQIFTVGVGDLTDKLELEAVASKPTCTHAYNAANFTDLGSFIAEIQQASLSANFVLNPGVYNFSCSANFNAHLNSNLSVGTTLMLSTWDGNVEIFGAWSSKFLASPAFHSFKDVATYNNPVQLFVRDGTPTSLAFRNASSGGCKSYFQITVTNGDNIKPDSHVTCIDAGLVSNCTSKDLARSPFAITATPGPHYPNFCIGTNEAILPDPTHLNRFIYCRGNVLTFVYCPLNKLFDRTLSECVTDNGQFVSPTNVPTSIQSTTVSAMPSTPITASNVPSSTTARKLTTPTSSAMSSTTIQTASTHPCTAEHIANQQYIWPYPGDSTKFIKCGAFSGTGTVLSCPPNKFYSHAQKTCLYSHVVLNPTVGTYSGIHNPCKPGSKILYQSHPTDKHLFIQCDQYGDAFVKSCTHNEVWDQRVFSCVHPGFDQPIGR